MTQKKLRFRAFYSVLHPPDAALSVHPPASLLALLW
jgi:hypothetical protein